MKSSYRNGTILLIDDDPVMLKLAGATLEEAGYNVVAMAEAPAGLEFALKNRPDLIVMDVMMPIINGFNICRLMKSEEGNRAIPVVLLTSRDNEDDRRIGTEVGADAYLTKPLDTKALLTTVQAYLKPQQSGTDAR